MIGHLRSEVIETRKRIIAIKHELKERFPEEYRVICQEAWGKWKYGSIEN